MAEAAKNVKLVVFDVDGVLTDGTLTYSANGEEVKHFNVKDGVGIKLLQEFDVEVAVISAKTSAPLKRRLQDLNVRHAFLACKDKLSALSTLAEELGVSLEEVAYCGDDVIDLKVMQRVGLAMCPSDAYALVKECSDVVTQSAGGQGVAREVCDYILGGRMSLEEAYRKAMLPEFEEIKKRS